MSTMNGKTTANQAAPDLLTVEEAARVLRIGRTKAYELARLRLVTGGSEGLPVVRVGHLLRVPRHALEQFIGGPITWPIPRDEPDDAAPAPITAINDRPRSTRRRLNRAAAAGPSAAVLGSRHAHRSRSKSPLPDC